MEGPLTSPENEADQHPVEVPCCGTTEAARAAGACCDPTAKREALAAGAGCCG